MTAMLRRTDSSTIVAPLILLAAGKGTRMMGLTANTPKALIPIVQNRCILDINIENVLRSKVATKVEVVGGHAWTSLREHLKNYGECELEIAGILNEDYDIAGPCRSVQLALAKMKHCDRIIIANGDTIFSPAAFQRMKVDEPGLFLLGSRVRSVQADDLVIDCAPGNSISGASKANVSGGVAIISSGLFAAVGANAIEMLSNALCAVLKRERSIGRQLPWHDIFSYFSASGNAAQLLLITDAAWYEFDSMSCIARFHSKGESSFLQPDPIAEGSGSSSLTTLPAPRGYRPPAS